MDDADYPALRAFLDGPGRPPDGLPYHAVQGFMFTVANAPDLVRPSEWLPVVLGDDPDLDEDELRPIAHDLLRLYNTLTGEAASGTARLPDDCAFRDDVLANLDEDAPVSQWARGFVEGHQWLEESWNAVVPDEFDEDYASMLMVLSFFSTPQIARAFANELARTDLDAVATTMRDVLPDAMDDYARLGTAIRTAVHVPRRVQKVGRNEPCPCGSGRKYKKCCGGGAGDTGTGPGS